MNGNIGCFTGWHIPLALLAIVVLIMTTLLIPLACLVSLKRRILKVISSTISYDIVVWTLHTSPLALHSSMPGTESVLVEIF